MLSTKLSGTLSKTFFLAFVIINAFNLLPLELLNYNWVLKVCMLVVDTSSLYLLSFIVDLFPLNKFTVDNKLNLDENGYKFSDNYINNKKKATKISISFYLAIIIITSFNTFYGIYKIENRFINTISLVDQQEKVQINKIKNEGNEKVTINNTINDLKNKKDFYLKNVKEKIAKEKFIFFKENARIIILSLIWAFGFFRIYKFLCI